MDFTFEIYRRLLSAIRQADYSFYTFEQFCNGKANGKFVILRHDVDLKAENSLSIAHIENKLGIVASYYFRVVPQSDKPYIIKEIATLGHEIGYHYEDMSLFNGDDKKAIAHFEEKLEYFRKYYPVKTICMHGRPTSRYDNRDLWKHYNYRDYGVIGEPYCDIDFMHMQYLTDTGRMWDGARYNLRDKVGISGTIETFHSTLDMIRAIEGGRFPERSMITTHPQRWTDHRLPWLKELVMQKMKNVVKRVLVKSRWGYDEKYSGGECERGGE